MEDGFGVVCRMLLLAATGIAVSCDVTEQIQSWVLLAVWQCAIKELSSWMGPLTAVYPLFLYISANSFALIHNIGRVSSALCHV
jgi:hypothetical protein